MSRTLLIDLESSGSILLLGNFINSLKKNNPSTKISILIDEKAREAIRCLKNITTVHEIKRKTIISMKHSPLFSDTFAFNEFMSPLLELKKTKWDHIINIGRDEISPLLTTYLMDHKHSGVCVKQDKTLHYSSYWAKINYDVLLGHSNLLFPSLEILHQMTQLKWEKQGEKVHLLPKNNMAITKKMVKIRKECSSISSNLKLVGILIKSSSLMKKITLNMIRDFLHRCLKEENFYPIILTSLLESEKKLAHKLNELFHGSLPLVEYDLKSLSSILSHLDLLVAPDTDAKHVADLTETPMVELSLGESPLFEQSTILEGNIIIRPIGDPVASIKSSDVLKACHLLETSQDVDFDFSQNITAYKVLHKGNRCEYLPIGGYFNPREELNRIVGKDISYYISSSYREVLFKSLYEKIFHERELTHFVSQEKKNISMISKSVLSCLRSVYQIKSRTGQGESFIKSLDQLLKFCQQNSISSLSVVLFRTNIESLNIQDHDSNIEMVKNELFSLKSNLQKIFHYMSALTEEKSPLNLQKRVSNDLP